MGTEVLRPQDLLIEGLRVRMASERRRNSPDLRNLTNIINNRKQNSNTSGKRSPPKADKKKSNAAVEKKKSSQGGATGPRRKDGATNGGLVMGQVTLLRRGESLSSLVSKTTTRDSNKKPDENLEVYGTDRIGPESPEMMPKQVRLTAISPADWYAGAASISSPSPRSVPLPSFLSKDRSDFGSNPADDSGGRHLMRLLRLD